MRRFILLFAGCTLLVTAQASEVAVTNATDLVNGDTLSPDTLFRTPGMDGISLREALQACNNAAGPHTITFDPSLTGKAIGLMDTLTIAREGIAIAGNLDLDGRPGITLDLGQVPGKPVNVTASQVALRYLRFVNCARNFCLWIRAGGAAPLALHDVRVQGNEFVAGPASKAAISVGIEQGTAGASISDVTISGNTFTGFDDDGINAGLGGVADGCVLRNLRIERNRFHNTRWPVEFGVADGASNSRVEGVRVTNNTFVDSLEQAIVIYIGSSTSSSTRDCVVTGSVFSDNVFEGCKVGIDVTTGTSGSESNQIIGTRILRNTFLQNGKGVFLGTNLAFLETSLAGAIPSRRNVVTDTVIADNSFDGNVIAIHAAMGPGCERDQILSTAITGNSFSSNIGGAIVFAQPRKIARVHPMIGNEIANTVIARNTFRANLAQTDGGVIWLEAGRGPGSENLIRDTRIVGNLITGSEGPHVIKLAAGDSTAQRNRVAGVLVANNTIAENRLLMSAVGGVPAVGDNVVTGVRVVNTIFWRNERGDLPTESPALLAPSDVSFTITRDTRFAAVNGNSAADPGFVDAASLDFHLRAGSPAIDAAAAEDAPELDLDGRPRFDDPSQANSGSGTTHYGDLGAYEFDPAPFIARHPRSKSIAHGERATFAVAGLGEPPVGYQWRKNGMTIDGARAAEHSIVSTGPADAGGYTVVVSNASGSAVVSEPAFLGFSLAGKVAGSAREFAENIRHSNGNVFDQILLEGSAASFTADDAQHQISRMSFVDLDGDIVQVEFSGPGTLSLALDAPSGPAKAEKYNQDSVSYMKGHAGIVIAGATERTNVSVFSVGKATAVNQALFKEGVKYDGIADLAFIAILSSNGKFGGVRAANASFFASKGHTGIYAPSVEFTGPVFVGDVSAFDSAKPVIVLGSVADVRITGGDLFQDNGQSVQVTGITQLKFTAGSDSHGRELAAQRNRAVLMQDGQDVTAQIVVNP